MTGFYEKREIRDADQQLRIRPDKLPSASRQTVMERAYDSFMDVNHTRCSQGFVRSGIANVLDGTEDGWLTPEAMPFWG